MIIKRINDNVYKLGNILLEIYEIQNVIELRLFIKSLQ